MVCESLLIMCLDFGIRQDQSMLSTHGHAISKLDVMKSIIVDQLNKYRNDDLAENLYVVVIGFTQDAKIIGMSKASEISKDRAVLNVWFDTSVNELRMRKGMLSNLTSASKLARSIYDKALVGDMSVFKLDKFESFYSHMVITEPRSYKGYVGESQCTYQVPNIRVILFSGGMQSNAFELKNYFESAKLCDFPYKSFTGVISVHLNGTNTDLITGYENMYKLAGTCPVHGRKGIVAINCADDVSKFYKTPLMFARHFGVLCEDCIKHEVAVKAAK